MKNYLVTVTCAACLLLSACSTPQGPNQYNGTLLGAGGGALAGGLIGSSIGGGRGALLGAGIGGLAGGFAGNQIGKSQDDQLIRQQRGY